jgi:hypothetical protein
VYDPNSDHRRKGVYRKDDKLKTKNTTLEVLVHALLNVPEEEVANLVRQIRTCESLDSVAEDILAQDLKLDGKDEYMPSFSDLDLVSPTFETHLSSKMGELKVEDGIARYIGGTSNLLLISDLDTSVTETDDTSDYQYDNDESPLVSWTSATEDETLIEHLITMYFTWHYPYFTCLSKKLFFREFRKGYQTNPRKIEYCTPLLVNAMLALGCHFTGWVGARAVKDDASTAGDHFFREAKRLIMLNDEYETPKLATVQALALMSVREAGCGREYKGWVYSGMSFRMACDRGLNLDTGSAFGSKDRDDEEVDARRITFWGCFLFDK